jgi:hypothetical protein
MNIFKFRLELANPFDRWEYFKPLGSIGSRLFAHKAWELEHSILSTMFIDIDIDWKRQCDHAGLFIGIGMLGYGIMFSIYDTRHWNYTTNSWEEYNFDEYFKTDN